MQVWAQRLTAVRTHFQSVIFFFNYFYVTPLSCCWPKLYLLKLIGQIPCCNWRYCLLLFHASLQFPFLLKFLCVFQINKQVRNQLFFLLLTRHIGDPEVLTLAYAMTPPHANASSPADSGSPATPPAIHPLKLLTFSTVNATIWFRRAEVRFRLKTITSSHTQADHILAVIPDTLFPQMSAWLDAKGWRRSRVQWPETISFKKILPFCREKGPNDSRFI